MNGKISKETIMPDGRPLFAWENEIEMQRAEIQNLKENLSADVVFRQAMGLIYEYWKEPQTLDWHFRISTTDAVTAHDFKHELEKYLKLI
jgi:hypothetical protein